MNVKSLAKWSIVLFLLAALPAMTVVMAQGQEPANQLPVQSGQTELQTPFLEPAVNCNLNESEPNDTRSTADVFAFGDAICGHPEYDYESETCGPDWFRFHMPRAGNMMLTVVISPSEGYTWYELSDAAGHSIEDVGPFRDHIMFHGLAAGDYFIHVYNYLGESCGGYQLILERPLLISASAANLGTATVAGIPFRSEDILSYSHLNNGEERWAVFFDGSDVGLKTLTNVEAYGDDQLLLGVAAKHTLSGAGIVTPWDMVIFDPEQYGSDTRGTFLMSFNGRMNDLTASGEKLDAIAASQYCDYLSTTGTATVPFYMGYNIKFKDEDLGCWYTDIEWLFGFESRNVPGMPVEDVFAAAYDDAADKMYLTILGSGQIAGHRVTQKDIFAINYPGYTWDGLAWHGPDHGWNYNIDAVEFNGW